MGSYICELLVPWALIATLQVLPMLGMSNDPSEFNSRVAEYLPAVEQLNSEFRNPVSLLLCVCLPYPTTLQSMKWSLLRLYSDVSGLHSARNF